MEKTGEWDLTLCFAKTDVLKAYDLVKTDKIIEALDDFGFAPVITNAIVAEWERQKQTFIWEGSESGAFGRCTGLPQGDPLSPLVFNIVMS